MNKRAEYSRCVYRYLLCAILIFLLSFLFPYTGDDWAWGSQIHGLIITVEDTLEI